MIDKYVLVCLKGKQGIRNKVPHLATFPPYQQVFLHHCKTSAIVFIWKQPRTARICYPEIEMCG